MWLLIHAVKGATASKKVSNTGFIMGKSLLKLWHPLQFHMKHLEATIFLLRDVQLLCNLTGGMAAVWDTIQISEWYILSSQLSTFARSKIPLMEKWANKELYSPPAQILPHLWHQICGLLSRDWRAWAQPPALPSSWQTWGWRAWRWHRAPPDGEHSWCRTYPEYEAHTVQPRWASGEHSGDST